MDIIFDKVKSLMDARVSKVLSSMELAINKVKKEQSSVLVDGRRLR